MAFDRTPISSKLDPAMVAELRDSFTRSLQTGDHGEDLKGLLSRAATDARGKGIQAEQLMLALKDIWYAIPQLSKNAPSEVQTRLLQQLISRCIHEYYAS
jgi:hypothetical protein